MKENNSKCRHKKIAHVPDSVTQNSFNDQTLQEFTIKSFSMEVHPPYVVP